MNSVVEQIKDTLSIVDVVSQYVTLEKSGSNYKGKSPFTNEKTPSFFVSSERNLYHCFSSGKGGDIFTFVSEMEGVDFKGALKILAEKANIPLTPQSKESSDKRDALFKVMRDCTYFYTESLKRKEEARAYITSRGITEDTITLFNLGYAPKGWSTTTTWLTTKAKHSLTTVLDSGIAKKNDAGKVYDRLRERIIFPIADGAGRVIAFTGRILPESTSSDAQAKYINSPETDLYKKSEVLFGYNLAKEAIRKEKEVFVMEGQMDVVLAHQHGVKNSVALSGTALSNTQITLLERLTDSIIFALDNDAAGQKALVKSAYIALSRGVTVYTITLPDGRDPADIFTDQSLSWESIASSKKHVISALLKNITRTFDEVHERQEKIVELVYPLIGAIPTTSVRGPFIHEVTQALVGVTESEVKNEIELHTKSDTIEKVEKKNTEVYSKVEALTSHLYAILEWQKNKKSPDIPIEKLESELEKIANDSKHKFKEGTQKDLVFMVEIFYNEEKEKLEKIVTSLLTELSIALLIQSREKLLIQLHTEEQKNNTEKVTQLLKQIDETSKKIHSVKSSQIL